MMNDKQVRREALQLRDRAVQRYHTDAEFHAAVHTAAQLLAAFREGQTAEDVIMEAALVVHTADAVRLRVTQSKVEG